MWISRSWMRGSEHYSRTAICPYWVSHPKQTVMVVQPLVRPFMIMIYRRDGRCLDQLLGGNLPQLGFMCPVKRDFFVSSVCAPVLVSVPVLVRGYLCGDDEGVLAEIAWK